MSLLIILLKFLNAFAFLFYGLLCLFSPAMVEEFKRYGLDTYRVMVGSLEVLGGLGVLAGFVYALLGVFASLGLGALMFLGVLTRLRIRDPWYKILPAFSLMILNLWFGIVGIG